MTDIFAQIERRSHELVERGNAMYKTNVSIASITWVRAGQSAGTASVRGGRYALTFSRELALRNPETMLNEVVPHEVAHLITFATNAQGRTRDRGHGVAWRRVCIALGGTGSRTHDMPTTRMRRTRSYLYMVGGMEVWVGAKHHNVIQRSMGERSGLRVKSTGDAVAACHYTGKVRVNT